jgi:hypothetical protein
MGFRSWLSVKRAVGEATSVTVSETVIRGASYLQEAYRQRIDLGAGLILKETTQSRPNVMSSSIAK